MAEVAASLQRSIAIIPNPDPHFVNVIPLFGRSAGMQSGARRPCVPRKPPDVPNPALGIGRGGEPVPVTLSGTVMVVFVSFWLDAESTLPGTLSRAGDSIRRSAGRFVGRDERYPASSPWRPADITSWAAPGVGRARDRREVSLFAASAAPTLARVRIRR